MMVHATALLYPVIIALCVNVSRADNFTKNFNVRNAKTSPYQTRKHRLLSFNADPNDNINIELDFTVPFISIPVKSDLGTGSMANLNIGAVALAGMMAFGAAFVIPATYHLFSPKNVLHPPGHKGGHSGSSTDSKYRNDDVFPTASLWNMMSSIDKALTEHNIDSTSCVQRVICWTVKESSKRMTTGQATSTDKIVEGLATNPWITHFVDGSVFQAAIESGLQHDNCAEEYQQCSIDQESIRRFGKQIMNAAYNRK